MRTTSMLSLRTHHTRDYLRARVVAACLIAALLVAGLPSSVGAAWRDRSSELPGMTSNSTVIAVAAVGGAAVVALVVLAKKKGGKEVAFEVEPPRFDRGNTGPAEATAIITNKSNAAITVTQLSLEGDSGTWSLHDGRQVPFNIGPGERVDVAVSYSPGTAQNRKAHLRVVGASAGKKDTTKVVSFAAPRPGPDPSAYPDLPEGIILPQR